MKQRLITLFVNSTVLLYAYIFNIDIIDIILDLLNILALYCFFLLLLLGILKMGKYRPPLSVGL